MTNKHNSVPIKKLIIISNNLYVKNGVNESIVQYIKLTPR